MAIPLMDYLDNGTYSGFDVGKKMIAWCKRHIGRRRRDFDFTWAPVYNRKYNPFGTISGTEFRFPYPDSSFDFAFATSLFTHLVRADAQHYLAETARVLRPGGTCLLTFFLIGSDAEREMAAGRAALDFRYMIDGGMTIDPRQPEESVAYRVGDVRAMFADAGLSIREPLYYGLWANTPGGRAGQTSSLPADTPNLAVHNATGKVYPFRSTPDLPHSSVQLDNDFMSIALTNVRNGTVQTPERASAQYFLWFDRRRLCGCCSMRLGSARFKNPPRSFHSDQEAIPRLMHRAFSIPLTNTSRCPDPETRS